MVPLEAGRATTSLAGGASSLPPWPFASRTFAPSSIRLPRPASRPSQPFGLTVCLSVVRGRLLVRSCALPADSGHRRPPLCGAFAPQAAPRRWSLGCWCAWAAGHASAREAGRAAAARPPLCFSVMQRAAREALRVSPGVTPASPQVPTGGRRVRWAPLVTAGAGTGHRSAPGGRESLFCAVCMYSLYNIVCSVSDTTSAS